MCPDSERLRAAAEEGAMLPSDEVNASLLARRLEAAPEEEMERLLGELRVRTADASPPPSLGWLGFLEELFAPTPRVLFLLAHLRETEVPPSRRLATVARFSAFGSVQERWADWTSEREREELRLRLEVLARADVVSEHLVEFLAFFFRASDSSMYQPASVTVGRHLSRHRRIAEYVAGYARARGVDLSKPIRLDGTRFRRRFLLVLAGRATVADSPAASSGSFADPPMELGGLEAVPLHRSQDLAVYLGALDILAEGSRPEFRHHALDVLRAVARDPAAARSRVVAQRWGRLLATLGAVEPSLSSEEGVELWIEWLRRDLDRYASIREEAFGAGVALLATVDELLRATVYLEDLWLDRFIEALEGSVAAERAHFLRARLRTWLGRARRGGAPPLPDYGGLGGRGFLGELLRLMEEASERALRPDREALSDARASAARRLVCRLLDPLASRSAWLRLTGSERALTTFLLLDESLFPSLPPGEFAALIAEQASAAGGSVGEGEGPEEPARARWGGAAAPWIVARITGWEGERAEDFVDGRLLHQCDDTDLLLSLLPTGRRSELLPFLADAFEHRLRLGLARDPEFDPERFVLRIAARKPHPSFFSLLHALVVDRSHVDPAGKAIPVAEWLEELGRDAEAARRGKGEPTESPGLPTLAPLRRRLLRCRAATGLPDLLDGLFAALDGGAAGERTPGSDATSLALHLNDGRIRPIRSGPSPWARVDLAAAREEAAFAASRVGALDLTPGTFAELDDVRVEIHDTRFRLRRLRDLLPPLLPPIEARVLEEALQRAEEETRAWVEELEVLEENWKAPGEASIQSGESRWERLLSVASRSETVLLRKAALKLLWGELVLEVRGWHGAAVAPSSQQVWRREEALLRWAVQRAPELLDPDDRGEWLRRVSDRWREMAEEAMAEGFETRLVRLVRGKEGGILALRPETEGVLEHLRLWFLDAYRIGDAMRLTRIRNARQGLGFVGSFPRELGSFFVHYSRLWLALLVGAVLMLDFGDAWTAMAEVEDVRGITATFILGVGGAFAYVAADLRTRVRNAPEDVRWKNGLARLGRVALFLLTCLVYTLALTSLLWLLLSGTDEVVHGPAAVLHVVVWGGFALFIGVFFGLLAKAA